MINFANKIVQFFVMLFMKSKYIMTSIFTTLTLWWNKDLIINGEILSFNEGAMMNNLPEMELIQDEEFGYRVSVEELLKKNLPTNTTNLVVDPNTKLYYKVYIDESKGEIYIDGKPMTFHWSHERLQFLKKYPESDAAKKETFENHIDVKRRMAMDRGLITAEIGTGKKKIAVDPYAVEWARTTADPLLLEWSAKSSKNMPIISTIDKGFLHTRAFDLNEDPSDNADAYVKTGQGVVKKLTFRNQRERDLFMSNFDESPKGMREALNREIHFHKNLVTMAEEAAREKKFQNIKPILGVPPLYPSLDMEPKDVEGFFPKVPSLYPSLDKELKDVEGFFPKVPLYPSLDMEPKVPLYPSLDMEPKVPKPSAPPVDDIDDFPKEIPEDINFGSTSRNKIVTKRVRFNEPTVSHNMGYDSGTDVDSEEEQEETTKSKGKQKMIDLKRQKDEENLKLLNIQNSTLKENLARVEKTNYLDFQDGKIIKILTDTITQWLTLGDPEQKTNIQLMDALKANNIVTEGEVAQFLHNYLPKNNFEVSSPDLKSLTEGINLYYYKSKEELETQYNSLISMKEKIMEYKPKNKRYNNSTDIFFNSDTIIKKIQKGQQVTDAELGTYIESNWRHTEEGKLVTKNHINFLRNELNRVYSPESVAESSINKQKKLKNLVKNSNIEDMQKMLHERFQEIGNDNNNNNNINRAKQQEIEKIKEQLNSNDSNIRKVMARLVEYDEEQKAAKKEIPQNTVPFVKPTEESIANANYPMDQNRININPAQKAAIEKLLIELNRQNYRIQLEKEQIALGNETVGDDNHPYNLKQQEILNKHKKDLQELENIENKIRTILTDNQEMNIHQLHIRENMNEIIQDYTKLKEYIASYINKTKYFYHLVYGAIVTIGVGIIYVIVKRPLFAIKVGRIALYIFKQIKAVITAKKTAINKIASTEDINPFISGDLTLPRINNKNKDKRNVT